MSARPHPDTSDRYKYFVPVTTRWADNDIYGHVNNVAYYSYFDTVANQFLINEGGLDIHDAQTIGIVVESKCTYFSPLAYPQKLRAGLRVDRLGETSVTYGIAIFSDESEAAAAQGYFVHVFVDRKTNRPLPIPESLRDALERIA